MTDLSSAVIITVPRLLTGAGPMQRHPKFWVRFWLTMPTHVRRGLLRLYVALSVPWIAWFGYQIASHGPQWRYLSNTLWTMIAVPVGGPVLLIVILWIREGFHKQSPALVKRGKFVAGPSKATAYELEIRKNPSTAILVISLLLFPRIWVIDFTLVSLYWVARLPKFK
jgi:hypothetical protein